MDKVEKYMKILKLNAIIYDDRIIEELTYDVCLEYILSDEFLNDLSMLIDMNRITKHLDSKVKDNIRDILFFLRTKINKTNKINELIGILNNTTEEGVLPFYRDQYLKRANLYSDRARKKYPLECFDNITVQEEIRFSMMQDYDYMNLLLEDEETFFENETEFINDFFINTINITKYDCSDILLVGNVNPRIKYLLEGIKKESYKNGNDLDSISRYRAKTLLKKLKK